MPPSIKTHRDLRVYRTLRDAAVRILQLTRRFPREERYLLTSQIRSCAWSACAGCAEAWRKRRYPAHFLSKLTEVESEAAETQVWLEYALEMNYIAKQEYDELDATYEQALAQLVTIGKHPEKWTRPSNQ